VEKEQVLKELRTYESELIGILDRFNRTRDGIHIDRADDPRFREMVIELRDFLDDNLGRNSYSIQIVNFFNEGISNWIGSPSYKSVENIRGLVSSVIVRIERNPNILSPAMAASQEVLTDTSSGLEFPQTVTLSWLWQYVPIRFWWWLLSIILGLVGTAFYLGIKATQISLVKEIFGLNK
jgi:hypothetical protein